MNRLITAVVLNLTFSLSAHAAVAGSGTLQLSGTLKNYTCAVNAQDIAAPVNLGKWTTQTFSHAGARSASASFTLHLADCPPASTISVGFSGAKFSDDGLLTLSDESSASGVAVQIRNQNGELLTPNTLSRVSADNTGSATLTFSGNYVSTAGQVKAGSANASVEYNVTYE